MTELQQEPEAPQQPPSIATASDRDAVCSAYFGPGYDLLHDERTWRETGVAQDASSSLFQRLGRLAEDRARVRLETAPTVLPQPIVDSLERLLVATGAPDSAPAGMVAKSDLAAKLAAAFRHTDKSPGSNDDPWVSVAETALSLLARPSRPVVQDDDLRLERAKVRIRDKQIDVKVSQLDAARECGAEARHYLDTAYSAWKERDDVGMEDSLGHIHDALRRLMGEPRGDGYPDSYPTTDEAQQGRPSQPVVQGPVQVTEWTHALAERFAERATLEHGCLRFTPDVAYAAGLKVFGKLAPVAGDLVPPHRQFVQEARERWEAAESEVARLKQELERWKARAEGADRQCNEVAENGENLVANLGAWQKACAQARDERDALKRELASVRSLLALDEAVARKEGWDGGKEALPAFFERMLGHRGLANSDCEYVARQRDAVHAQLAEVRAAYNEGERDRSKAWADYHEVRGAYERLREACEPDEYVFGDLVNARNASDLSRYVKRIQAALTATKPAVGPKAGDVVAHASPPDATPHATAWLETRLNGWTAGALPKPGTVLTGEQAKAYMLANPGRRVRNPTWGYTYEARNGSIRLLTSGGPTAFDDDGHKSWSYTVLPLGPVKPAVPSPVEPDPDAPKHIEALPSYWDARRKAQGKPDASRCGAELRVALDHAAQKASTPVPASGLTDPDQTGSGAGAGISIEELRTMVAAHQRVMLAMRAWALETLARPPSAEPWQRLRAELTSLVPASEQWGAAERDVRDAALAWVKGGRRG